MSGPHHIEAELSAEIKADLAFSYTPAVEPSAANPEGWKADVWIEYIQPLGIVPPIAKADLEQLAHDWLFSRGGFDACCRLVASKEGSWE